MSSIYNMIFSEPALSIAWQSPDKYVAGSLHLLQAAPEALDGAEHDLGTPEYVCTGGKGGRSAARRHGGRIKKQMYVRTYSLPLQVHRAE